MAIFKPAALALAGASVIALTTVTPADAQWRYHRGGGAVAAAGIGFAAGALIGAAAANAAVPRTYYYGDPYGYYGSPYASYNYYDPAPAYYEPAPVYVGPSYGYYYNPSLGYRYGNQTYNPNQP